MNKNININEIETYRKNGYRVVKGANGKYYAYERLKSTTAKSKYTKTKATYTINGKTKRVTNSTVLVTKKGAMKVEALSAISKKINVSQISVRQVASRLYKQGKRVTWKTVTSMLIGNKVERFLNNMDVDIDMFLEDIHEAGHTQITMADVLNINNWTEINTYAIDGPFKIQDDKNTYLVQFKWSYDNGSYYEIPKKIEE